MLSNGFNNTEIASWIAQAQKVSENEFGTEKLTQFDYTRTRVQVYDDEPLLMYKI